jgi:8-hydroxy-5-deazaflavin:NADPH oxidoreductase
MLSFARDPSKLDALASELGPNASVGDPAQAVAFGEVVILSVPWGVIVVQWICGDDQAAKDLVAGLFEDIGYVPVDLGGTTTCGVGLTPEAPTPYRC